MTDTVTTTSDTLGALVVAALKRKTVAMDRVYAPRDWPTNIDDFPLILMAAPEERKESLGKNAPAFKVQAVFRLRARVTKEPDEGDAGVFVNQGKILAALGIFQREIEVAVINDPDLYSEIEQIAYWNVTKELKQEGALHIGEMEIEFGCDFYQGPADFQLPSGEPLKTIHLYGDLINVVDKSATYADPPFPASVIPAPRVKGPDGRSEFELEIKPNG